jgi:hypothetical protein
MAKMKKSSLWLKGAAGAAIAFLFSLLHLSPPAWATDEKDAIKALNQKVNLLMQECSRDRSFDDNLTRSMQNLDSIIRSYTGDGDTRMGKFLGDQPAGGDIRMGKFLGDTPAGSN